MVFPVDIFKGTLLNDDEDEHKVIDDIKDKMSDDNDHRYINDIIDRKQNQECLTVLAYQESSMGLLNYKNMDLLHFIRLKIKFSIYV